MPHVRALLAVPLAAALMAQPALSQINEADRLARCQNNRDAYARAEGEYQIYRQVVDWSEESISRARTAMVSLREMARDVRDTIELDQNDQNEEYYLNRTLARMNDLNRTLARMIRTAASFGVFCMERTPECALGLPDTLAREIDRAVAGQHPVQIAAREMARYRTNLIALRCDQTGTVITAATGVPNFAGSWRGTYFNADYILSQSGATVTWSAPGLGESARGSYANGTLTMSWNGSRGSGTASGNVVTNANGIATEIRWSNGNVFRRQ